MARTIAVINDDTVFLDLMHDLLTQEGYETHLFKEGANAYAGVRALRPDGIILDIRMETPASGWHVLDLLRLDPQLRAAPVIVCSADVRALEQRAGYLTTKGCLVLAKPFDLDDLLVLLRQGVGPLR